MFRVLLAAVMICCGVSLAHAAEKTELFVLHSYSEDYPWTERQHEGFMARLEAQTGRRFALRVEYLDTKRVAYDERYAGIVSRYLTGKYAGYRPDAVYVTDDNALRYVLDHLPSVFGHPPVFFSGVNDYGVQGELDPTRVTGVFERKEIGPNLELVRRIAPDVRGIVVVGDGSTTYKAIAQEIRGELRRQPDIQARFVAELDLDALLLSLGSGDESFVFLTTLGAVTNGAGAALDLEEIMAAIVALGRFTVISMEDVYLLPGVLGGYVTSGTLQGSAAAKLLLEHLDGRPLQELPPILDSPNVYMVDAAELARTGLELPPAIAEHAIIVNPLPSLYQRNQRLIVVSLYALAVMFVLLLGVSLLVVLRKNREIVATATYLRRQTALLEESEESLSQAQRIAGMGNWDWRIRDNRFRLSDGMLRLLDASAQQIDASYAGFMSHVHPDDRAAVEDAVRGALEQGHAYDVTHRFLTATGKTLVVRENAEIVRDETGAPLRMIGTALDITEREATAQALRESEATLRTLIESLPVVLWMIDADGRFLLSEGKGMEAIGLVPGQVVGRYIFDVHADAPDVLDDARRALAGETFIGTRWFDRVAFEVRYSTLRDSSGAITGAVGVAIDVTERKWSEKRLSFLANYDPVTHLPNRFLFNDRLAQALRTADRNGTRVGLLFVDLDHFKTINDTLGHAEGDQLLKLVATRLGAAVRRVDTVSRLGGDEFTVVLEDLQRDEEAASVAAKILEQSSLPYTLGASEVYLTPSIGIALYPQDGDNVDALVMNADAAMYRAKENGRNGFQFFTREINLLAQQRLALSSQLRSALQRNELSLVYQPKLDIASGRVIGFEALLRWTSESRGPVPPSLFVPVLEDTGTIVSVGEWVLHEACRWAASLPVEEGCEPLSVSVNLSARQIRDPNLDHIVSEAIAGSGLAANRLELEITESSLVDLQTNLDSLDRLRAAGARLSIDDFGTGYSSLSYLKRFPVDRLKVDASFVRDVAVDVDDAAIVTAIIGLAHNLGLRVIAEGVETVAQLDYLRDQHCDEIQGFLLARPMPAADVVGWLAEHRASGFPAPQLPRTARVAGS